MNNYIYEYTNNNTDYIIKILDKGIEIGEFSITGPGFNTGETMNMSISVNSKYQKEGFSKKMVKGLCEFIYKKYPKIRKDQLLFIDTDASWNWKNGELTSFWEYIGMKPCRYYDKCNKVEREGKGYELYITYFDLCKWANASINPKGGKQSKKKYLNYKKKTKRKRI